MNDSLTRDLPTEADTSALGAALARSVPQHVARALRVALRGELGAGKTTLVRGFLRQWGVRGAVRSPSYALLEWYEVDVRRALHIDLYRLLDPEEVQALGLRDYDAPSTVWLIEWPERAAGTLGEADLTIALEAGEAGHRAVLSASSPEGRAWMRSIE